MNGSRKEFGLLLASLYGGETATMIVRATRDSNHPMAYGVDQNGGWHLLMPIADDYSFVEISGGPLSLIHWKHPETGRRYMDLMCGVDQFHEVFASLVDDITRRVQTDDSAPEPVLQTVLEEWRQLLSPASPAISEKLRKAIFGELEVLRLLAIGNPYRAVESWVGPAGGAHSFMTPRADLEVITSSQEGLSVVISSVDQLDPPQGRALLLVRVSVRDSPSGRSIHDQVELLTELGLPMSALVKRLAECGFLLGVDSDDARYEVAKSPVIWEVTDDFPGLRSSDLPESRRHAITRMKYVLDLTSEQPLTGGQVKTLLGERRAEHDQA
ncbi:PD-(D/E)XK motif protein [Propionibacterium acidifaciens]|uniref:PD-(D/E)XK motif protein n=1 Tax=Propionibacterium acidifaciens TaxID=556499 RepID=UPI00360BF43C